MTPNWFTALSNTGPEYTVIVPSHHRSLRGIEHGRSPTTCRSQAIPAGIANNFSETLAISGANMPTPAGTTPSVNGSLNAGSLHRTDLYRRHLHHRPHA